MRRSRLSFWCLLGLIWASQAWAALTATTIFEVQPTTGSNLNGGCYDNAFRGVGASIDYTYDAPQVFSFTDLTAAASTALTTASNSFTAAMVGNCLHLESAAAGTPGYILIVAFVSAGEVTMEASRTITTGVGKLGGATASYNGQTTTTLAASLVAGNIVYHKASGQTWNEAVTFSVVGSAAAFPIIVEGYNVTRGDTPTGTSRPTNARGGAGTVGLNITVAFYLLKNIVVSGAGTVGIQFTSNSVLQNVRSTGNGTIGFLGTFSNFLYNCESDLNTTVGVSFTSIGNTVLHSNIHNNTGAGFLSIANGINYYLSNIIAHNASHGVSYTTATPTPVLVNNTIDCNSSAASCGSSAVDGVNIASGLGLYAQSVVLNNIFSNNGRDGFRKVTAGGVYSGVLMDYNDYFGNVGTSQTNAIAGTHDTALNPGYANAASGDYAIGMNLQALGIPGLFPAGTSMGYTDMGAIQRKSEDSFHVFP